MFPRAGMTDRRNFLFAAGSLAGASREVRAVLQQADAYVSFVPHEQRFA